MTVSKKSEKIIYRQYKLIIMTMNGKNLTGRVEWFDEKKGFGVIQYKEEDNTIKEYFAHHTEINVKNNVFRALYPDEEVEFIHSYNESKKKLTAKNITGLDGNKLKCEVNNTFKKDKYQKNKT